MHCASGGSSSSPVGGRGAPPSPQGNVKYNRLPMIRDLLRILILALVVLAVPAQGFAAVSGGICMELGHHGDGLAAHDHDGDGSSGKHSDDGHCAPCAACCAGAVISAFPPLFIAERAAIPLVAAPLVLFHTVAPDRLDRPPLAS